jgi:hypothetical protein
MKIQRDNLRLFFSLSLFFMVGEDEVQEKREDKIITKNTRHKKRKRVGVYKDTTIVTTHFSTITLVSFFAQSSF